MPDRQRNPQSTGNPNVCHDFKTEAVESIRKINEQPIRLNIQGRPRINTNPGLASGNLKEVDEHQRTTLGQTGSIDFFGANRGHNSEVSAHRTQNIGHRARTRRGRKDAEVMDHATVRGLRKTNSDDDVVATQASCTIGVDNHEGLHACGIEERGQAGFCANRPHELGADPLSVLRIQGDHCEGTLRSSRRMFENSFDDGIHFHRGRFNSLATGGRHTCPLGPNRCYGSTGGSPRDRNTRVINAVTRKQERHLVVQASRAYFHAQVRKNLGKSRNRIIDVFLSKISEKNDLRSTRNDRNKLRQRQCINVIQDDNIDLMILRQDLRDKSRNRQDRRDQIPRQGELRIQRGQRMLVIDS